MGILGARVMGFKKPVLTSVVLVAGVQFLAVFSGHSVTPVISLPDTFLCPAGAGSRISQDVTGASFPSVMGWQLNITYDAAKVSVVSVMLGSAWNAVSHNTAIKNATGSLLYGYSTLNGAVVSGTTTLASITWKFLVSPGTTAEHIVLTMENSNLGTMLLDPGLGRVGYTTTDGGLTIQPTRPCPQAPTP